MFYRHLIINNNIYLYIGNYEEFAKEFVDVPKIAKEQTIEQLSKDYLKRHKIPYDQKKIYLVLDGIVIASLTIKEIQNNDRYFEGSNYQEYLSEIDIANTHLANTKAYTLPTNDIEIIKHNIETTKKEKKPKKRLTDNIPSNTSRKIMIPLFLKDGKTAKIELETYVAGVLASIIPIHLHEEVLKAQAVIVRTNILKRLFEKRIFTPNLTNLIYKTPKQLKDFWKEAYDANDQKIKSAVSDTKGEYLAYEDYFINALYHYSNNGKTEDAINVLGMSYPYLKVVSSPWDKNSSEYNRTTIKDLYVINHLLGMELTPKSKISILEKTLGGKVSKIQIDHKLFDGKYLKDLLNLRSTDYDIIIEQNYVTMITRGYGSGLGMSQYGADGMAKEHYNYRQILHHYYPNTSIIKLIFNS